MTRIKRILLLTISIIAIISIVYILHTTSHIQYFYNKCFHSPLRLIEIYTDLNFSENVSVIELEFLERENISGWSPYAETLNARLYIPLNEVAETFQNHQKHYDSSEVPSNPRFPLEGELQFVVRDGGKITSFDHWWATRAIRIIVTKTDSETAQINLSITGLGWKLWKDKDIFISWR